MHHTSRWWKPAYTGLVRWTDGCQTKYDWGNWTAWCQMDVEALSDPLRQPGSASTLYHLTRMFMDEWTFYVWEEGLKQPPGLMWELKSVRDKQREWVQVCIHLLCHSQANMGLHRSPPCTHEYAWTNRSRQTQQMLSLVNTLSPIVPKFSTIKAHIDNLFMYSKQ